MNTLLLIGLVVLIMWVGPANILAFIAATILVCGVIGFLVMLYWISRPFRWIFG